MAPRRSTATGVFIITAGTTVIPESSELRALRKAIKLGGLVKFVPYGSSIEEGIDLEELESKRQPRTSKPKASAPAPAPAIEPAEEIVEAESDGESVAEDY